MLVDEATKLEDLLGLGRVVPWVEGAAHDEKADVAAKVGMAQEEPAESA